MKTIRIYDRDPEEWNNANFQYLSAETTQVCEAGAFTTGGSCGRAFVGAGLGVLSKCV